MAYSLKITFADLAGNTSELSNTLRRELLKHTSSDERMLKSIFDEASRGSPQGSAWNKIESIARFNALLGYPSINYKDIHKLDIRYQWVKYDNKRGTDNEYR